MKRVRLDGLDAAREKQPEPTIKKGERSDVHRSTKCEDNIHLREGIVHHAVLRDPYDDITTSSFWNCNETPDFQGTMSSRGPVPL